MTYVASSSLPVSIDDAFAYHDRPGALQRLIPPWESVVIEHSDGSLKPGSRVILKTRIFGVPVRWVAEHTVYEPPRLFVDRQVSGPFAYWEHRHEFHPAGDYCQLKDVIGYRLPLGSIGRLLGSGKARATLERMFAYRHRVTHDDLTLTADRPSKPMRVAVSGSGGLVGRQLCALLTLLGHDVFPIVRRTSGDAKEIPIWSDDSAAEKLNGLDAVVHLAGKPIAQRRWNAKEKEAIRDSRVTLTRELADRLAHLNDPPKVMVCASAIGIYGNRGDQWLDEQSSPGEGFLAEVAQQWEQACDPARNAGIRVVNARFGMVLSPTDGALKKMLLPAKLGGGALGRGDQWWSWIGLDDAVGALYHVLTDDSVHGPVNFVSPEPLTSRDFARTLAGVIHRPSWLPAPSFMLRLAMGEMADELLLASTRVRPSKLVQAGYRFRFPELAPLLRYALGYERLVSAEG